MKINVRLSTESIDAAISKLLEIQDSLEFGTNDLVEVLAHDGALLAQSYFGSMAGVSYEADGGHGIISASGEAVGIAEFGAGDDTLPVLFENYPGFDVYPGSYSEQVGSGEYALTGRWHFGGREYRKVEPRAGLYNAKVYIQENATEIAREVIKL